MERGKQQPTNLVFVFPFLALFVLLFVLLLFFSFLLVPSQHTHTAPRQPNKEKMRRGEREKKSSLQTKNHVRDEDKAHDTFFV